MGDPDIDVSSLVHRITIMIQPPHVPINVLFANAWEILVMMCHLYHAESQS